MLAGDCDALFGNPSGPGSSDPALSLVPSPLILTFSMVGWQAQCWRDAWMKALPLN